LKTRYRSDRETRLPHTISATMVTDRVALAILENNQQEDGSVLVPKALQPFMGVEQIKAR
jgi:seryl-tRNA synthetase